MPERKAAHAAWERRTTLKSAVRDFFGVFDGQAHVCAGAVQRAERRESFTTPEGISRWSTRW